MEGEKNQINGQSKRPVYGRIKLSLEPCLLSNDRLHHTPSMEDGLTEAEEYDLRLVGCELIQSSGILLRLPQVAMATAQVLLHRFYFAKSLVRHPIEITAMSCVALASKIEEAPRRMRDVINVFHRMKQIKSNEKRTPLLIDYQYALLKDQLIKSERRLLKELGFCVHVKHPHKFIVTLIQVLENEKNPLLIQTAWNYMNDCLRTDLFVRFSPETIACSCVFLSARLLKITLPDSPPWFEIFQTNAEEINQVCFCILKMYTRGRPDREKLDKIVEKLKQKLDQLREQKKSNILSALKEVPTEKKEENNLNQIENGKDEDKLRKEPKNTEDVKINEKHTSKSYDRSEESRRKRHESHRSSESNRHSDRHSDRHYRKEYGDDYSSRESSRDYRDKRSAKDYYRHRSSGILSDDDSSTRRSHSHSKERYHEKDRRKHSHYSRGYDNS